MTRHGAAPPRVDAFWSPSPPCHQRVQPTGPSINHESECLRLQCCTTANTPFSQHSPHHPHLPSTTMPGHDYTDSEPEIDPDELIRDIDNDNDDAEHGVATPTTQASAASPTKEPKSKDSNQSLKITVRVSVLIVCDVRVLRTHLRGQPQFCKSSR